MGSFPRGANGSARVNPRNPQAFGICDRSGLRVNHCTLSWQMEWQGSQLQNKRLLVRPQSLDRPQEQLRSYAVPADPIPINDPRPDGSDMTSSYTPYLQDENGTYLIDEFGHLIVISQPLGPASPGTPANPPPPVSSLIPLVDGDGNTIVDDFGQVVFVEGTQGPAPPPTSAPGADFSQPGNTQNIPVVFE